MERQGNIVYEEYIIKAAYCFKVTIKMTNIIKKTTGREEREEKPKVQTRAQKS